ncbi:NAD(P)/FAD-dependent oxidoreductase [Balneola vulgaris]|uniref:NAD(P)/FAD-dependent oxidoreductase n=1 Tax=Balneola vulgaris TaxID=287535 RepID=UPI0003671EF9|nr:FAD-dependent oxidoreductase [Balneola vulgaris]
MKIAIIGAGVAGLTAGRILAEAGHEVMVYEKSRGLGGRLATRYAGENNQTKVDHGLPYIEETSEKIQPMLQNLVNKGKLVPFSGPFMHLNEAGELSQFYPTKKRYVAPMGMNQVGKELARYVDVQTNTKVSGVTHIGEDRTKKRSWMLNFPTGDAVNVDAVVIATPSKQAYAILNTTIDEVATLKLLREVDAVEYDPCFSLMVGYGDADVPEWSMMECDHPIIASITNEVSKRGESTECSFVIQTTAEFARANKDASKEAVEEEILDALGEITGGWSTLPAWSELHFWRYSKAINPLPYPFMEVVGNDAPIALIGSYMNGDSVESAYLSGLALGQFWSDKFKD